MPEIILIVCISSACFYLLGYWQGGSYVKKIMMEFFKNDKDIS